MTRLTIFADIAGRVSLDATGSNRMTGGAVAVESGALNAVRTALPSGLPKWGDAGAANIQFVLDFLLRNATAFAAVSVRKDTPEWTQFWEDSKPLIAAIATQDRRKVGFVKPANIAAFDLLARAATIAAAHAIKVGPRSGLVDYRGLELVEHTIICDSDIQGDESIEVFRGFWRQHDNVQPLVRSMGFRFTTRAVKIQTEQEEPLLLIADYLAGIAHAALLEDQCRIKMPLSREEATTVLDALKASGKFVVLDELFQLQFQTIFDETLQHLEQQGNGYEAESGDAV